MDQTNFLDKPELDYYICRDIYGWEWRFWMTDGMNWNYRMLSPIWPIVTFNYPYSPTIPGMFRG